MGGVTRGQRNIDWIEAHCRVPEGQLVGQPFKLRAWQRKVILGIYDSPTRRAIISFGRKNGKTALAAVLLLLHLVGPEAKANSQLFSAAQSRDQAAVLFALAAKIVRQSPDLNQYVGVRDTAKQLYCQELGTLYRALSAEASTAYGLSPVFVVHDELGQVVGPRSELYEALETAAGAQESPLSIVISTQAPTDADLLSVLIDDAKSGADQETKLFLYTAEEAVDPFSVEAIRAANPAYGDFLNAKEVRQQAESARRMPARESAYRNLVLNQRVNLSNPLISRSVWMANAGIPDAKAFAKGPVYLGLDLSARLDLSAAAAVVRVGDVYHCQVHFWTPLEGLAERSHRDRAPYDVWVREGYITATPGTSVDYSYIAQWLSDFCDEHPVKSVKFDRWRMDVLQSELGKIAATLPLEPFGQGFKDMTPAIDVLETALISGNVRHGGNPVLNMCAHNATAIRDAAGNRKLDKMKSTGRIDGVVAMVMAMAAASVETPTKPLLIFSVGKSQPGRLQ